MLVGDAAAADLLTARMCHDRRPVDVELKPSRVACGRATSCRARSSRARRRAWRPRAARWPSASCAAGGCWRSARARSPPTRSTSSVEFVHPVIVGKRALPALDLSLVYGPWLDAICRPDDMVMGFGPPGGDPRCRIALEKRAAARRHDLCAARTRAATTRCEIDAADPFVHQEMIEILYHTLWETVHVFFEHRELGLDAGAAGFLYPFLGTRRPARRRRSWPTWRDRSSRRRVTSSGCAKRSAHRRPSTSPMRSRAIQRAVAARRQADSVRQRRLGDRCQRLGASTAWRRRRLSADSGHLAVARAGHDHRHRQRRRQRSDLSPPADRARAARGCRHRHLDERRIEERRRWRSKKRESAAC